jgi:hypothetical protein
MRWELSATRWSVENTCVTVSVERTLGDKHAERQEAKPSHLLPFFRRPLEGVAALVLELEDLVMESHEGEAEACRMLLIAAEGTSSRTGGSLLGARGSGVSWDIGKRSSGESSGEAGPMAAKVTAEKVGLTTGWPRRVMRGSASAESQESKRSAEAMEWSWLRDSVVRTFLEAWAGGGLEVSEGESGTGTESGDGGRGFVVVGIVVEMELIADWIWEETSGLRLVAVTTDCKTCRIWDQAAGDWLGWHDDGSVEGGEEDDVEETEVVESDVVVVVEEAFM